MLTDSVKGVSTVPSNYPTAGMAGSFPFRGTLVSRIHWSFLISQLMSTTVALDGAMIVFSMLALNIFHPGRLLSNEPVIKEEKEDSVRDV